MSETNRELLTYISEGPSPYHAVDATARRLQDHGFEEIDERAAPEPVPPGARGFVRRAGSLVAWRAGTAAPAEAGFRLLGAHTDSPNLRLKPRTDVDREGYRLWGIETYGGLLRSTWMDRDLGLSGRVVVKDGDEDVARLLRIDDAIARIPNLAIHLNREVNSQGLLLDAQRHMPALVGLTGTAADLRTLLAGRLDVDPDDVLSFDLGLHDLQPPTVGGLDGDFLFAPRLDNQASCFQSLTALLAVPAAPFTQVVVLFDHEEIGSRSAHGAMGAFLTAQLTRLEAMHEVRAEGGLGRALANSWMVSLDMAHGVHPNYAAEHEPLHKPMLNGGPVIKEHVEQRYATDAESSAFFRRACEDVLVPYQDFVIRTDLACGSTIGPIAASGLGVRTVDVGCAMLSMHSIREQAGARDTEMMIRVLERILDPS